MHGLYPIIRRVRRPLIVQDTPPVMAGSGEPVEANAETLKTETLKAGAKMVNEVPGGTPSTTGETPVPPKITTDEETATIEESGPAVGN
jgi:hypothetical protein